MRGFIRTLAGPLDRATNNRPQDRRGQHGNGGQHPGLLLQRYLCEDAAGDKGRPHEKGNAQEKRALLQAAIHAAASKEVWALYRIAFDRWSAALPTDPRPVDLCAAGRLIVGLGSENVLETGIRLHHTYGLPIVPGSALKGLAAHYADEVWGAADDSFRRGGKYHQVLFGTTDDSGCVIFHDAWLTPGPDSRQPLVLDVMTPHHPEWLDGSVPPTDFDSPTPVPFLAVTGSFRVAVSWCGPASEKAKSWAELALGLLCDALKNWGVGGKTTSGYGRMVDPRVALVPQTPARSPAAVPKSKPSRSGSVKVTFLGPHDKLPKAFWVKEEGKKRGLLKYGAPREPQPAVDSEIEVYATNDNPSSPEYGWDPPPRPERAEDRRGSQRPRGRR